MRYLTSDEIKQEKGRIGKEFSEREASPAVALGGALSSALKFFDKGHRILDCGCGSGVFLRTLNREGFKELFGADFDKYHELGFLRDFKTLDFSFDKMPWGDSFFDAVTAWQVIEHLENPHNFVREVHRVLKPDSLFIFSMPNVQHIFNRIFFFRKGDMYRWREGNNHLALFPKGVFQKSFLKYFDLIDKKFTEGEVPYRFLSKFKFPPNEWFGRDVIYVLRNKK